MAKHDKFPMTMAVRELTKHGVAFVPHLYSYEERGGSEAAARQLGLDEYLVIKTLVLETDEKKPLICCMHGDKEVSLKQLARVLNVKTVTPCSPNLAENLTGYQVGGTSPFGTKKALPVYVEKSVLELERIYINGGKRGFLVEIAPRELVRILNATAIEVALQCSEFLR